MMVVLPNFDWNELDPGVACDEFRDEANFNNLSKLAIHLQVLRNLCKHPLRINSAFRSPEYNKSVGGAKNSYHVKGLAADISTKGWNEEKKSKFMQTARLVGFNGIGLYDTFIHIDLRKPWAMWNERTK